jgi:hypothetical protein
MLYTIGERRWLGSLPSSSRSRIGANVGVKIRFFGWRGERGERREVEVEVVEEGVGGAGKEEDEKEEGLAALGGTP